MNNTKILLMILLLIMIIPFVHAGNDIREFADIQTDSGNPTFIINDEPNEINEIVTNSIITPITLAQNVTKLWNRTEQGRPMINIIPDVDGDKLQDVMEIINTPSQTIIKIRKGSNGKLLWQKNLETNYKAIISNVPDIDGDKLRDFLLSEYNKIEGKAKFYAKKGDTGLVLWNDTVIDSKGPIIFGSSAGDLNRDRISDIWTLQKYSSVNDNLYKARIGKNGTILWKTNPLPEYNDMYAFSFGDLNKNGISDIILAQYNSSYRRIEARNGNNGKIIWSKNSGNISISRPNYGGILVVGDISGDNISDVLYIDLTNDEPENPYTYKFEIRARYGNNGTLMWFKTKNQGYGLGIDLKYSFDMNGDKVKDLFFSNPYMSSTAQATFLESRIGKNGTILWKKEFGDIRIFNSKINDINKDNIEDLIVLESATDEGYYYNYKAVNILSGKTGSIIWKELANVDYFGDEPYLQAYINKKADSNGDSMPDIVINKGEYNYDKNNWNYSYRVTKGNNGHTIWKESAILPVGSYMKSYPIGDFNGDGLTDIIRKTKKIEGGKILYTITAKSAPAGKYIWDIKSDMDIELPIYNHTLPFQFGGFQNPYISPIKLNGDNKDDVLFNIGNEIYAVVTK